MGIGRGSGGRMNDRMLCSVRYKASAIRESMTLLAIPLEIVGPGWSKSLSPHAMRKAFKYG